MLPSDPSGPPVRPRTGPLPYLAATGVAAVAMAVLVVGVALPATVVLPVGLLFLAVALVLRWLEDLPAGTGGRLTSWVTDHIRGLGRDYGVEFYGVASMTAFLRAEAASVADTELSVPELLDDPVGSAVAWLLTEAFESLVNAVFAVFWWFDLYRGVAGPYGLPVFFGILIAGWTVWRSLGINPPPGDPLLDGIGEGLSGLAGGLTGGMVDGLRDRLADGMGDGPAGSSDGPVEGWSFSLSRRRRRGSRGGRRAGGRGCCTRPPPTPP